ncbi:MAG: hypothetical protein PHY47_14580 [Lachnospiraceae bacterium]|nr:hypothetical protein [Lachnospiraceae bacterium]
MGIQEIGGYIEFEHYSGTILHEKAISLNCGRNCFSYLIKAKNIKKIAIPFLNCDCIEDICKKNNLIYRFYHINKFFQPVEELEIEENEWLYLVNYYGQLSTDTLDKYILKSEKRVICDNAHAYFEMPYKGIDTIYTCRKYFGVADGAFLYTDTRDTSIDTSIHQDVSYGRMLFLMGRFENSASKFYEMYIKNNEFFLNQPIKKMSKLTENILRSLNYEDIEDRRRENFSYLHECFKNINMLTHIVIPKGPFMYPLYVHNGENIRKELVKEKIYIPILWPNISDNCQKNDLEYDMTKNVLPLPVDQRYKKEDLKRVVNIILNHFAE